MKNILPKVSVIIPVYNEEKYLSVCVDSVLSQTLRDIEIVLVDDGSTDGSPVLCDLLAASDSRITVLHKKNEGAGCARNSGLEIAKGEYVTFVDSDDYIANNTLEVAYHIAVSNGADEVRYCFNRVDDCIDRRSYIAQSMTEVVCAVSLYEKLNPILRNVGILFMSDRGLPNSTGSACTAIYKREIIERFNLRFSSEYISEDYLFNIDFSIVCGKIIFTSEILYFYRKVSNSRTTYNENKIIQAINFAEKLGDVLDSIGYPDAKIFAMGYVVNFLRTYYRFIFSSGQSLKQQKKLFKSINEIDYISDIKAQYPAHKLPILQRIIYECGIRDLFYCCRALVCVRDVNLFRRILRRL